MATNVWAEHLDEELRFWSEWLGDAKWADARAVRIKHIATMSPYLLGLVGPKPGVLVRVLDVGSGPVSTVGMRSAHNPIELICTDALADQYNELLDRYGFDELPRIHNVKGEELQRTFGDMTFDIVNCANALDHFDDPAMAVEQMYAVCRPGGVIVITSVENEGERQGYAGLHQWNLRPCEEGLLLWNPSATLNLMSRLPANTTLSFDYVDHGQRDYNIFRAVIRRSAALDE